MDSLVDKTVISVMAWFSSHSQSSWIFVFQYLHVKMTEPAISNICFCLYWWRLHCNLSENGPMGFFLNLTVSHGVFPFFLFALLQYVPESVGRWWMTLLLLSLTFTLWSSLQKVRDTSKWLVMRCWMMVPQVILG